jgi:glycosyltransferase involved in cell wall biosynthesis
VKLVILTQYFYPEMGAPQTRLYELSMELRSLGWHVEIVTAMPNYPTGKIFKLYQGKFYRTENISGLTIHRYWLYPSKSSRAWPRIMSMLSFSFTSFFSLFKIKRSKPDFLLVESPPLTLAFTGWLLSHFAQAQLIMNVSDLWPLSAKELGSLSDGYAYRSLLKLESFLYKRSSICTGQSQEIVDYIKLIKKENVWLLRNGVDTSRFSFNVSSIRTNKIVYAGLLGVAQGVLSICQNVNFKSIGFEFHIYGSGNELEEIEKFSTRHPGKGIRYMGKLSRDQIPQVLPQYDAMLVPLVRNIYGAVPSKIFESMAAGLPIMFSGMGEGARIVQENELGWVNDPGDWDALSKNLVSLRVIPDSNLIKMKNRMHQISNEKYDRTIHAVSFHNSLLAFLKVKKA